MKNGFVRRKYVGNERQIMETKKDMKNTAWVSKDRPTVTVKVPKLHLMSYLEIDAMFDLYLGRYLFGYLNIVYDTQNALCLSNPFISERIERIIAKRVFMMIFASSEYIYRMKEGRSPQSYEEVSITVNCDE